jgi:hypothetical protein
LSASLVSNFTFQLAHSLLQLPTSLKRRSQPPPQEHHEDTGQEDHDNEDGQEDHDNEDNEDHGLEQKLSEGPGADQAAY